jgi:hypothetical protein
VQGLFGVQPAAVTSPEVGYPELHRQATVISGIIGSIPIVSTLSQGQLMVSMISREVISGPASDSHEGASTPSGSVERFYSAKGLGEVIVREGEAGHVLEPRPDLGEEGPEAFSWGRNEAGAAQLALALLADALNDDRAAKRYYQEFRRRVIANLPERWTISRTRILGYVRVIKYERGAAALIGESGLMPRV